MYTVGAGQFIQERPGRYGGPAGASASVQHGSQFGRKALRLPPLGVTQLEPFLEEENDGRCSKRVCQPEM